MATMADHTAGYASFSLVPPDQRILTVEYKINFLSPASGEYLECRSSVVKSGKTLLVTESEVYAIRGEEEDLVAKALLTMAAVSQEKVLRP
jgi:acyl-coenzyme A thioesterase PaaI-like protein